ncbi:hypothetical protein J437_LFUL018732 [Ladona fulva]|uniref:Uncharacterized protein n=1 Tax=Ladona fulva TaxID=123851 RepID=A0A8K0P9L1_LADFU|nr:hypothetical protein J437_LFUL018732 [Ladona fulva]
MRPRTIYACATNAHATEWQYNEADEKGEEVLVAYDDQCLTVLNNNRMHATTYAGHRTNIDVTACSSLLLEQVMEGITTSVHNALLTTIALERLAPSLTRKWRRFNVRNANWVELTQDMRMTGATLTGSPNKDAMRITDTIYNTCAKHIPLCGEKPCRPACWWSLKLEKQKQLLDAPADRLNVQLTLRTSVRQRDN